MAPGTGTQGRRRRRPGPRPPRTRDACEQSSSRRVKARGCGRTPSTAPSVSSRWPGGPSSPGRPTRCDAAVSTTSRSSPDTAPTRSRRSATRPCTTPRYAETNMVASLMCARDAARRIDRRRRLLRRPRLRSAPHRGARREPGARRDHRRPRVASPVGAAHGRPAAGRGDAAHRRARQRRRARAEARELRRHRGPVHGPDRGARRLRRRGSCTSTMPSIPPAPTTDATATTCT